MGSSNILKLMATLGLDSSGYTAGLKSAGNSSTGFMNIAKGVFGGMLITNFFTKATQAVVGFAQSTKQTGMEFEKNMSQVAATMGKTVDEMNSSVVNFVDGTTGTLSDLAKVMGETTVFSATQASEALNYMALAGYDAQQSANMLPPVLNLAAAGNMELARASDMVTDAQTAFGLSAEETTAMIDQMAATASDSNTSVEQLGDAFLVVGGLERYMQGGTQELATTLGIMASAGVKGSEAGTHLRNMLLKLSDPTSDGTQMMKQLGIEVFDASGKMRSMQEIMGDLSTALSDATDEKKIEAVSALFNTRDMAAANALLNATAKDWNDLGSAIEDSAGAAEQMAETQLDNLAGDTELFKSAAEGLKVVLFDGVNPALRGMTQAGTSAISTLKEGFSSGGLLGAFTALASQIQNEGPKMVSAGLDLMVNVSKGFVKGIPNALSTVVDSLQGIVDSIGESLPQWIEKGHEFLVNLVDGFVAAIPVFIEKVPQLITSAANLINDNAFVMIQKGADIVGHLIVGLLKAIPTLLANLPKIFEAMYSMWQAINWINFGKHIITAIVKGIGVLFTSIGSALTSVGENAVKSFLSINWLGVGKNIVTFLKNGVTSLPSLISNALKSLGQSAVTALQNINWMGLGRNIVEGIVAGVRALGDRLITTILDMAKGALNAVKNFFGIESPSKVMRDQVGKNLVYGIVAGIDETASDVYDAMEQFENLGASVSFAGDVTANSGGANNPVISQSFYFDNSPNDPDQMARAARLEARQGLITGRPIGVVAYG